MKTVKKWLKEGLSEKDYKKAKKNNDKDWIGEWVEEVDSFQNALCVAFVWKKTPEGYDYWRKIHDNDGSIKHTKK